MMNHLGSRKLSVLLLVGLLNLPFLPLQAADRSVTYLSVMEDLPLAPGLKEVPGSALVFDSAQGRIVEGYAAGKVERQKIVAFYGATLAQLGWTEFAPGRFHRESEELTIEFTTPTSDGDLGNTVRFALSPNKSGGQ
jgi:hypothetical protein